MKYVVVLTRQTIEETVIEFDWPEDAGKPTTAHVEGYALLSGKIEQPDGARKLSAGPWTVKSSNPSIQPAKIVRDGRPRGTRKTRAPKAEVAAAPAPQEEASA